MNVGLYCSKQTHKSLKFFERSKSETLQPRFFRCRQYPRFRGSASLIFAYAVNHFSQKRKSREYVAITGLKLGDVLFFFFGVDLLHRICWDRPHGVAGLVQSDWRSCLEKGRVVELDLGWNNLRGDLMAQQPRIFILRVILARCFLSTRTSGMKIKGCRSLASLQVHWPFEHEELCDMRIQITSYLC